MSLASRAHKPLIPQIDGERLWQSLMELAQIGATPRWSLPIGID